MMKRRLAVAISMLNTLAAIGCTPRTTAPATRTRATTQPSTRPPAPTPAPPAVPSLSEKPFIATQVDVDDRQLSCALAEDGRVACWGKRQVKLPDSGPRDIGDGPWLIEGVGDAIALEVDEGDVCMIRGGGNVTCWSTVWGFRSVDIHDAVALERTSNAGVCALRTTGAVQCWGWIDWLEGSKSAAHDPIESTPLPGAESVESLSCFRDGCCSVGEAAQCWGRTPAWLASSTGRLSEAIEVVSDDGRSCTINSEHHIDCWGDREPFELPATGLHVALARKGACVLDRASELRCVDQAGDRRNLGRAKDIAMGDNHSCFVDPQGGVHCWGDNALGQLGDGRAAQTLSPEAVELPHPARTLTSAHSSNCVQLENGNHRCWGDGASIPGAGLREVQRLGDGQWISGCAIDRDGSMACLVRSFGVAPTRIRIPAPFTVQAMTVDRGGNVCAVASAGTVWCRQSLGEGGHADTWTRVKGVKAAIDIVSRSVGFAVLTADGRVYEYEDHRFDADDDFVGAVTSIRARPRPGLKGVVELAAGQDNICARTRAGEVWCWGRMGFSYQWLNSLDPVEIVEFRGATALSANHFHVCAVRDAQVWCFGDNQYGQLGNGDRTGNKRPVRARIDAPALDVGVGEDHTCALTTKGRVYCWGFDGLGQLGRGRVMHSDEPIRVVRLGEAIDPASGPPESTASN